MEYRTDGVFQTEALGEQLGRALKGGAVIAYTGDLGAGKTAFTRGLARGLDIPEQVTSPTFTIVNEYEGGRLPLFHFDMYRLGSSDELFDIGWEDYLERGGICAVEWSEIVEDALPEDIVSACKRHRTDEADYGDHSDLRRYHHAREYEHEEKILKAEVKSCKDVPRHGVYYKTDDNDYDRNEGRIEKILSP